MKKLLLLLTLFLLFSCVSRDNPYDPDAGEEYNEKQAYQLTYNDNTILLTAVDAQSGIYKLQTINLTKDIATIHIGFTDLVIVDSVVILSADSGMKSLLKDREVNIISFENPIESDIDIATIYLNTNIVNLADLGFDSINCVAIDINDSIIGDVEWEIK